LANVGARLALCAAGTPAFQTTISATSAVNAKLVRSRFVMASSLSVRVVRWMILDNIAFF